jgi:hypothetical protein
MIGENNGRRNEKGGTMEYKAIVWSGDERPGERLTVLAETLEEARQKLVADYGPKATISVWNEEDASRPRFPEYSANSNGTHRRRM